MVVDASVMTSAILPEDVNYQATWTWLDAYLMGGGTLRAPILLLVEVAGAIARRTGDPSLGHDAVRYLQALPGLTIVPVDQQLGTHAWQLAADLRLKGADATYVALAAQEQIGLVTWDEEQRQRGAQLVTTLTPNQIETGQ